MSRLKPKEITNIYGKEPEGYFALDTSWLLYKGFYAFKHLKTKEGKRTGHYYFVVKAVRALLNAYPKWAVILCKDQWSKKKEALYPEYKANREERPFSVEKVGANICLLMSVVPGVYYAFADDEEADSVMATIATWGKKTVIYSGDDDMLQCIGPSCIVMRKFEEGKIVPIRNDYVKEKYGVKPHQLPLFRALRGDTSDNIKGYLRFPKRVAKFLAQKYDYPEILIIHAISVPNFKIRFF